MKILSAEQIYQADQATITKRNITSTQLMEEAATVCFNWIQERFSDKKRSFYIFCGVGNNGGDGLVIARKLIQNGFDVKTFVVNFSKKKSQDFLINYNRLKDAGHPPVDIKEDSDIPEIPLPGIVIDAIFGIGLTRPPVDFTKNLILKINNSGATIISVDFSSGLYAETSVIERESVIKATYTLTFQNPKLAFLLPENEKFTGEWQILDIGLDKDFIQRLPVSKFLISIEDIRKIYKTRSRFSHKGTYGHSLIIGGSFGKIGAVVMAAKAAVRVGSGLVTAYAPKCGYQILQTLVPEVMTEVDSENEIQFFNFKTNPNVIGLGMGLGTSQKTAKGFLGFLKENTIPLVLDADALNILSVHREGLELILPMTILTPHPKEFERLAGKWENDYEKLQKLSDFSKKYNCITVLKGAFTAIAFQDQLYFNSTGNPGLATGGSGDVLTGVITGLLAQGYDPMDAAVFGVFLHGRAADLAMNDDFTAETLSATDLNKYFGKVFTEISGILV